MNIRSVLPRRDRSLGNWLFCAALLALFIVSASQAQLSDADKKKRDAFLKAREEMHTISSPTPSESATPSGKPKAAKKKSKTKAKKSPTPNEEDEEEAPRPKAKKSPSPTPAKAKSTKEEEEPRAPKPSAVPRGPEAELPPIPPSQRIPAPNATVAPPPADITIQKSGVEEEQGYEPPPPPPPKRSFWQRLFGGGDRTNYRYLSRSVIDAIRRAPVQRGRWKFIIVHNSGTNQGNARAFDYYHRHVRRMKNGLAYHFVVGNGSSSGDGQIEIGDRWRRQINGGHVHSDYLNNISLGICLVGDFNRTQPTPTQLAATEELIKYLRQRCGGGIPVRPHRAMNPPQWATDCPGDSFPYSWFGHF
ncbi:MAG TPA: N-acetylmuramoyl-L-alanine amidase [Chthoniobacterales bacterium]